MRTSYWTLIHVGASCVVAYWREGKNTNVLKFKNNILLYCLWVKVFLLLIGTHVQLFNYLTKIDSYNIQSSTYTTSNLSNVEKCWYIEWMISKTWWRSVGYAIVRSTGLKIYTFKITKPFHIFKIHKLEKENLKM